MEGGDRTGVEDFAAPAHPSLSGCDWALVERKDIRKNRHPAVWVLLFIVTALFTPLAVISSVGAIEGFITCRWDSYGRIDRDLLAAVIPGALYLTVLALAFFCGAANAVRWVVNRSAKRSRGVVGGLQEHELLERRLGLGLVVHPLVLVLAVLTTVAGFNWVLNDVSRIKWRVASDEGAATKGLVYDAIYAIDISDAGVSTLVRHNKQLVMLDIEASPRVTTSSLRELQSHPRLSSLRFQAAGPQSDWGDPEALLLARPIGLKHLRLNDFSTLTLEGIERIVKASGSIESIDVLGEHSVSRIGSWIEVGGRGQRVTVYISSNKPWE